MRFVCFMLVQSRTLMASIEHIDYYSPPHNSSKNKNHQTKTAYADSCDDGKIIDREGNAFTLRRLDVFAVWLEINLEVSEEFCCLEFFRIHEKF